MAKTNAEHQEAWRQRQKAYIRKLEDERIAAYEFTLSMMSDRSAKKLHALLNLLECRDLLRERRREKATLP